MPLRNNQDREPQRVFNPLALSQNGNRLQLLMAVRTFCPISTRPNLWIQTEAGITHPEGETLMLKIRLITIVYLMSAVAVACGSVTPEIAQLRPTLRVSNAILSPGGEIEVLVTLRNQGRTPVVLTGSSSCPPFGFGIVDSPAQPLAYRTWRISRPHLRLGWVRAVTGRQHGPPSRR